LQLGTARCTRRTESAFHWISVDNYQSYDLTCSLSTTTYSATLGTCWLLEKDTTWQGLKLWFCKRGCTRPANPQPVSSAISNISVGVLSVAWEPHLPVQVEIKFVLAFARHGMTNPYTDCSVSARNRRRARVVRSRKRDHR
jgi:hypothetical protein